MNPDPTYYRNMPSYALNNSDKDSWAWNPLYDLANEKADEFKAGGQVDWDWIYGVNQGNTFVDENGSTYKRSKILLYEDRQEEKTFSFNTNFKTQLSDKVTFDAGLNYRRVTSHNFKKATDLLGGDAFYDIDTYQKGNARYNDLNKNFGPDGKPLVDKDGNYLVSSHLIGEGDKFGYNYKMFGNVVDVFTQFNFDYDKFDFYIAQKIGYTQYQREGLYRNGVYANDSYGKSGAIDFNNFGFKGGATYHITWTSCFKYECCLL